MFSNEKEDPSPKMASVDDLPDMPKKKRKKKAEVEEVEEIEEVEDEEVEEEVKPVKTKVTIPLDNKEASGVQLTPAEVLDLISSHNNRIFQYIQYLRDNF